MVSYENIKPPIGKGHNHLQQNPKTQKLNYQSHVIVDEWLKRRQFSLIPFSESCDNTLELSPIYTTHLTFSHLILTLMILDLINDEIGVVSQMAKLNNW